MVKNEHIFPYIVFVTCSEVDCEYMAVRCTRKLVSPTVSESSRDDSMLALPLLYVLR